jgi:hypothetical protein
MQQHKMESKQIEYKKHVILQNVFNFTYSSLM